MKNLNFIEILNKELVGKKIKIASSNKQHFVDVLVKKLKNGITKRQKETMPEDKIYHYIPRQRLLATHTIYSVGEIIRVFITSDGYNDYPYFELRLGNNEIIQISFSLYDELVAIDNNTYILK